MMRSAPNFTDREIVNGGLEEVWFEDKFKATSWLTLSGGVRQSHFTGSVTENATSPRAGISIQVPKINWVFHGFYGHFYQAPPLLTFSGPALVNAASGQGYSFGSLFGERDEEYQFGVTMPYKGWSLDADTFRTRANNFFDHNNLGRIQCLHSGHTNGGVDPRLGSDAAISAAMAQGSGTPGLLQSDRRSPGQHHGRSDPTAKSISPDYGPLDHDQRNTLNVGAQVTFPGKASCRATCTTARASAMAMVRRQRELLLLFFPGLLARAHDV